MADFNLLGTSLTDLYQEVGPLEFSYLDTLDSASLQHLDHLSRTASFQISCQQQQYSEQ